MEVFLSEGLNEDSLTWEKAVKPVAFKIMENNLHYMKKIDKIFPARSPELFPLDCFFWRQQPECFEDLRNRITKNLQKIIHDILTCTVLNYSMEVKGGTVPTLSETTSKYYSIKLFLGNS